MPSTILASGILPVGVIAEQVAQLPPSTIVARLCHSDTQYPRYQLFLAGRDEFGPKAERLIANVPKDLTSESDWIIQPLLDIEESATALLGFRRAVVEQVAGAPRLLLRDGAFCRRQFYGFSNNPVDRNEQVSALRWNGRELSSQDCKGVYHDFMPIITKLQAAVEDSANVLVFELGAVRGEGLILDFKQLGNDAFPVLRYENIGSSLRIFGHEDEHEFTVDKPSLDYLPAIPSTARVRIRTGALTAHLCVSLAERRIPCLLGRT